MKTFLEWLRRFTQSWNVPVVLLITCLFSYGLLLPWLSFYLDDWYIMWSLRTLGPGGFFSFFHEDRPFIALLFWLSTPILGQNPLVWQLFGLFTRWLAVWAFYWALRQVWPNLPRQVLWTALLFVVYPGFKQQWVSVFYSNAFILMVTFMLSLGCMAASVRQPKRFLGWTAAGVLLSVYTLVSWEYYFGLDLVRLAILWVLFSLPQLSLRQRAFRVLRYWAPYLFVWLGYFVWRAFFFRSARYDIVITSQLRSAPLATLLGLLQTAIQDVFTAVWADWIQVTNVPHVLEFNTQTTFIYWGLVLLSAVLAWFYLRWSARRNLESDEPLEEGQSWARQAIGVGLFSLPLAGIPFWAAGLHVEVDFPGDRFTLAMMFGVSLLLGGLLELLLRTPRQKHILLTLALSLAVGANFQVANTYRRESDALKLMFWQLAWRAPDLNTHTTVLANDLPFNYYSDTSLTSPLNWVYQPDQRGKSLAYLWMNAKTRAESFPQLLTPKTSFTRDLRNMTFQGNSADELALQFTPPGCLHVLGPDDASLPELPGYMVKPAQISNLAVIQPAASPPVLPAAQFGKEPAHTWCYYYEKMDLAAQQQQWTEVTSLALEAQTKGLTPAVASEWLPQIYAAGLTGQGQQALAASRAAYQMDTQMGQRLCVAWQRIANDTKVSTEIQPAHQAAVQEFNCRIP